MQQQLLTLLQLASLHRALSPATPDLRIQIGARSKDIT